MSIGLKDIRLEFQNYLKTQVSTVVTLRPGEGGEIDADDPLFYVDFTARNVAADDAVQLVNVVYHLKVADPTVAKLLKPPGSKGTARKGPLPTSAVITEAEFPVGEYYLHPPTTVAGADPRTLMPNEADTISGLPAKPLKAGLTEVECNVFADPDMKWLFPPRESSQVVGKELRIHE